LPGEIAVGSAGCYGGGARFLFALHVIEPLRIRHRRARRQHADPGAMGGFGKEDRNIETAGEDRETGDVVLMLVGDQDRVEPRRVFTGNGHALEEFAAGEAGVDQNPGARAGDDGAVAFGSGGEHCHAHHWLRIRRLVVGM